MFKKKNKELTEEEKEVIRTKSFFDMILPSTIKFSTDHYVCGDSYRCVWAIKEYPPTTEELALFSTLADRNNLTIHFSIRCFNIHFISIHCILFIILSLNRDTVYIH